MRRIIGVGAAWVAATLVAVAIAAAAVGSVRGEVTDAPTALGTLSIAVVTTSTTMSIESLQTSTSTSPPGTTTTTVAVTDETTTTLGGVDTTSVSTTSTTAPPVTSTTETTTTVISSYTRTYGAEAGLPGSVTVVVSGESVSFSTASALNGWRVELKNSGPEEVKVLFERNENKEDEIEFKAKVQNGELEITISDEH